MKTIKTKIHTYSYNLNSMGDAQAYRELTEKLQQDKDRRFFNVLAMPGDYRELVKDGEIELETEHLFSNQWNSTTARVFDWYEAIYPNRHIKAGHWLEITDEMREIRATTLICGYCGKNYPKGTAPGAFCTRCLDSEYLKESDLFLLRLLPVGLFMPNRQPLTADELAQLKPLYIQRQTTGTDSRAAQRKIKVRQDVEKKHEKEIRNAETEYKGMIWLLDRDVNIDNCLFYSHTGVFSFGWRQPVSASVKSSLLDLLCEFPYPYEIKAEDGNVSTKAA